MFDYIKQERNEELNSEEKESVIRSLIHYLLDNSFEDANSTFISAYILRCRNDVHLANAIDNILEGVVRYVGVNFDTPFSASSRWTNEMTIYLDTEILFHMAGYNGTLYKQLFDDFYDLVDEINNDGMKQRQRKLIYLKYFDYVTDEIDFFFDKAIDIINGKIALNPSVTAMKEITLGCKSESEVAEKKGLFLDSIKKHGIEPDNNGIDYYSENQYAFNLESGSIAEKYYKENNNKNRINYRYKRNIQNSLLSLSHINVLRQGVSNRSFEKIGFVLLTDNYITERLAWMGDIKKDNEKPLCTNLYYITNRMWYRLGKAFGNNVTPKVFDVISKAQIILSTKINDSVFNQYEVLVEKLKNNEISSESALEVLYQLRSQVKNPEEIDSVEEVDEAIQSVGEPELQKYIEEAEFRKTKLKKAEEENERLTRINEQVKDVNAKVSRQNESINQENESIKKENDRVKAENLEKDAKIQETTKLNADLIEQLKETRKNKYNSDMELYKKNMKDYVEKRKKQTKHLFALFIAFLVVSVGLAYFTIKFDDNNRIPNWIKMIVAIILGQIIPIYRSRIAKISLKLLWKTIIKKDISTFEEEYKSLNCEPVLEE